MRTPEGALGWCGSGVGRRERLNTSVACWLEITLMKDTSERRTDGWYTEKSDDTLFVSGIENKEQDGKDEVD